MEAAAGWTRMMMTEETAWEAMQTRCSQMHALSLATMLHAQYTRRTRMAAPVPSHLDEDRETHTPHLEERTALAHLEEAVIEDEAVVVVVVAALEALRRLEIGGAVSGCRDMVVVVAASTEGEEAAAVPTRTVVVRCEHLLTIGSSILRRTATASPAVPLKGINNAIL